MYNPLILNQMNQLIQVGNHTQAKRLSYGYKQQWDGTFTVKLRMRNEAYKHLKLPDMVAEALYVTEPSNKNCVTLYGQLSDLNRLLLQIAVAAALSKRHNW